MSVELHLELEKLEAAKKRIEEKKKQIESEVIKGLAKVIIKVGGLGIPANLLAGAVAFAKDAYSNKDEGLCRQLEDMAKEAGYVEPVKRGGWKRKKNV